jgi:3-oxoacyl-[acyl-carrier-protein] synthase-3
MAFLQFKNVKISGISACVPKKTEENADFQLFDSESYKNFVASTGVERKRVSSNDICTSDLCIAAAEKLLADLGWGKDEIDILIFVTQTPDYVLPATACILQDRLGLPQSCYALDISLGCSGWVYGLSVVAALLASGNFKKGLLLAGDTSLKLCSKTDKSTYPLFGDAGTATAVEFAENATGFNFHMQTNGSEFRAIIIPDGGYRNPISEKSLETKEISEGISRNATNLILEGMDIFTFGISKVPKNVSNLLEHFNLDKDSIDYFVFHQANRFMNEKIRQKLKLSEEKVPYSLKNFGNTSSSTIPLTIVTQLKDKLYGVKKDIIACGFGVGLSWGSVYFEAENIMISNLIEL